MVPPSCALCMLARLPRPSCRPELASRCIRRPMTRRLLQDQGWAPTPSSIGTIATPATPEGGSAGAQARPVASFSVRDPAAVPHPQAPASSWAASGAAPAQPAAMASLMQAGRTAGVHGPMIEGANAPSTAHQTGLGTARGSPDQGPHPSQIPVSALEAGLVQDRTGTTPTGSGEERVKVRGRVTHSV